MDLELFVNNLLRTHGVIANRKTPEEICTEKQPPLPPKEFHLCVIDENLKASIKVYKDNNRDGSKD